MQIKRFNSLPWWVLDLTFCLLFTLIPLFIKLPYRVNIFLSWEGAYRLYLGQVPFRDFSLPMGFGYWLVPTFFFKLFSPTMYSLIIAQVFLNVLCFYSIRGILLKLGVKASLVTLSLLVCSLTYILYNFWPWYNNSVVIFELASIWFLLLYLCDGSSRLSIAYIPISAFLAFLSFFTKQDVGIICFLIEVVILVYDSFTSKSFIPLVVFILSYIVIASLFIVPFLRYDFAYWFNLGQFPHNSRITLTKLLDALLVTSFTEKIYLGFFLVIMMVQGKDGFRNLLNTPNRLVLSFLCIALIGQAMVTRVTSPLPTDHMTYFHTFGFVLLVTAWPGLSLVDNVRSAIVAGCLVVVLYSEGYWNYASRFLSSVQSGGEESKETKYPKSKWVSSDLPGFENVLMPRETSSGIKRLLDQGPYPDSIKVLNMSELTPLAVALPFEPLTNQPMWFHLGVSVFKKEVDTLSARVKRKEYDLVLFEDIPDLTNFYPYQVRDSLRKYYHLDFSFLAPRKLQNSTIEVYSRKEPY